MADTLGQQSFSIANRGRPQGFPRATRNVINKPVIQNPRSTTVQLKKQVKDLSALKSRDPTNTQIDNFNPKYKPSLQAQVENSLSASRPVSQHPKMRSIGNFSFRQTVKPNDTQKGGLNMTSVYGIIPDRSVIN